MQRPSLRRRTLLAGGAAFVALPLAAQPRGSARPLVIGQAVDASQAEQDVSKDFLVGSRAAWQAIQSQGGLRGRPVQHVTVETDGSAASVRQALRTLLDNPNCVALSGTVGDPAAVQAVMALRQDNAAIAHAAPWLQNSGLEVDERTFPIFAGRQEQIAHALKSLSVMGVSEVGAVYASERESSLYQRDVAGTAAALRLKLATFRGHGDLEQVGRKLGAATPALLLFLGGTPELVQFTRGLEREARQRYVIALADVNLQTVLQMGAGKATPVIATQPVPMPGAPLSVVRRYRDVLSRLFDEPPAALSLAGFIAARYTFEVLNAIEGPVTRASALAAFQRRADVDVGGYRVSFDDSRRSAGFVTQSMLTPDGRVVG
jgi:ABC-type branched-subunit amino acid transport system substrate-binding protein